MKERIITGIVMAIVFLVFLFIGGYWFSGLIIVLTVIAFWELLRMVKQKKFSIATVSIFLIGILYVSIGMFGMVQGRLDKGAEWMLSVLLTIWATDSGAYFIGKRFGKTKLAKKISPNKTVEGSAGGTIIAILINTVLQVSFHLNANMVQAIILTIAVSIIGQAGDLIESAVKRYFGVKDSGKIFPGHGGVLDRLDSWILVFIGLKIFGWI